MSTNAGTGEAKDGTHRDLRGNFPSFCFFLSICFLRGLRSLISFLGLFHREQGPGVGAEHPCPSGIVGVLLVLGVVQGALGANESVRGDDTLLEAFSIVTSINKFDGVVLKLSKIYGLLP
jgi:hypothetical protein